MRERVGRTEGAGELVGCLVMAEALDGSGLRIHDPVMRDAEGRIPLGLGRAVVDRRIWRKDLDHEGGRPFYAAPGDETGIGHDDEVRLDNVVGCQDDVNRGIEHFSPTRLFEIRLQKSLEPLGDPLVQRARGRGHVDLSVQQFIPLPIGGDGAVVVVVKPGFDPDRHVLITWMRVYLSRARRCPEKYEVGCPISPEGLEWLSGG